MLMQQEGNTLDMENTVSALEFLTTFWTTHNGHRASAGSSAPVLAQKHCSP